MKRVNKLHIYIYDEAIQMMAINDATITAIKHQGHKNSLLDLIYSWMTQMYDR